MVFSCLPPDILTDILLRLPTKNLSKARFVNKFLFQFISSSDFVKAHLKISKKDKELSDHRVIFVKGHYLLKQVSTDWFFDSSSIDLDTNRYPAENRWLRSVRLVGSCNGLVCLVSPDMQLLVLNPCTGTCNILRHLDGYRRRYHDITFGFGYDESNDDYKVVALLPYDDLEVCKGDNRCRSMVYVYRLKCASWKRIEDFKGRITVDLCAKLVRGKLHWLTTDWYSGKQIVSFDVEGEVFGIVELPSGLDDFVKRTLEVLEGYICLLLNDERSHTTELWVMKEYGVKESWTEIVTVNYDNDLRTCSLLPTGEILFFTRESFVVYNPKDNSFKFLDMSRWGYGYCGLEPLFYVQSLVSPVCTERHGRKKAKLV